MAQRKLMLAHDITEAVQVKAFLESRNIRASLPDQHFHGVFHYIQNARVMVEETDYEKAVAALREVNIGLSKEGITYKAKEEGSKKLNRALGASLLSYLGIPIVPAFYSLYLLVKTPRIINFKFFMALILNASALSLQAFIILDYLK